MFLVSLVICSTFSRDKPVSGPKYRIQDVITYLTSNILSAAAQYDFIFVTDGNESKFGRSILY